MYIPLNLSVFTAAYSGALAGMGSSDRLPTDPLAASYANLAAIAGAYAQSFDTAYGATPAGSMAISAILELSEATWQSRSPILNASSILPATYTSLCNALIAILSAASAYFTAEGIPTTGTGPQVFTPVFSNPTLDAAIGDGTYSGTYYEDNNNLIINLALEVGATTVFGASPLFVPLPPGYTFPASFDLAKWADFPALGFTVSPGGNASALVGGIPGSAPPWATAVFGVLIQIVTSGFIPFAPGDVATIQYQLPLA